MPTAGVDNRIQLEAAAAGAELADEESPEPDGDEGDDEEDEEDDEESVLVSVLDSEPAVSDPVVAVLVEPFEESRLSVR